MMIHELRIQCMAYAAGGTIYRKEGGGARQLSIVGGGEGKSLCVKKSHYVESNSALTHNDSSSAFIGPRSTDIAWSHSHSESSRSQQRSPKKYC